ncbi:peptidylprolyl isomerase fpr4 [Mortierella alpina]|nr:peptidylprolyl isomerase fpr4 [Mortierella alpina]
MILGFWGLTVFPHKTYTQIVDNSFKLTMAALDEETRPGRSSVRVSVDGRPYVLCSLIAGNVDQQPLDLVFTEGEEITISVSGDNVVHLSGNYLPEEAGADYGDEDDMYGDMDDEDEEDDAADGQGGVRVRNGDKRIATLLQDEDEDEDSEDDPDFTGEDSEEEDDDEDEDENEARPRDDDDDDDDDDEEDEDEDEEDDEAEEGDDQSDASDEEEGEDEDEDEEEVAPVVKTTPTVAIPSAKKQKVSEEKAVPTKAREEPKTKDQLKKEAPKKDTIKTLPNGLIIEDIKLGEGARAKAGKKIGMRYIGRLTNGKVFDKNTSGKPFSFKLGNDEVIKGWDIGIKGMQLGGERRLTIPAALA